MASGICVLRRELAAYFCVTVSVPTAQELADMHPYSVPIPVHASTDSLEITDVVKCSFIIFIVYSLIKICVSLYFSCFI